MDPLLELNTAERKLQFIYLISILLGTSILINWILFRNLGLPDTNTQSLTQQIARQQEAQNLQNQYLPRIDTAYKTITQYQPQISAVFMEVDIETQLNEIRAIWEQEAGAFRGNIRYKAFAQIADLYRMIYFDKRILWSLQQNRVFFNRQLDDCNMGVPGVQPMTGGPTGALKSTTQSTR